MENNWFLKQFTPIFAPLLEGVGFAFRAKSNLTQKIKKWIL